MPATITDVARALILAATVLAGSAGCGSSTDEASVPLLTAGTVSVTSRAGTPLSISAVEPIKLGKNDLGVTAGAGVELVTVSALMPAHGHGTRPPSVERTAEGYRVKELVLYMSGRWEVRLALRAGAVEDEALITIDVP
ncbi:MAG: hypothetical protein JST00_08525 [Deltaproteobacteria bacterium]|nr:hypothetical protein [Deltaproteobacteria bacterium]